MEERTKNWIQGYLLNPKGCLSLPSILTVDVFHLFFNKSVKNSCCNKIIHNEIVCPESKLEDSPSLSACCVLLRMYRGL